jgi:class 3 adenylate cyclase/TolB-like protein
MTRTSDPTRRLSAVLFSDIVAFTRLTAEDDAGALRVVETFQACARECVSGEDGRLVRFVGDSVLAEFASADAAVRAGLLLVRAFAQRSAAIGRPCELRVGIHVGELTEGADGDIYGASVNLAARVQSQARPQQVAVSEDVWRQLRGRTEYSFELMGARELKGIPEPVTLYQIVLADSSPDDRRATPAHVAATVSAGTGGATPVVAQQAPFTTTVHGRGPAPAQPRLIVLPFRLLRTDPEVDFLAFGLADAITTSLSGIRSVIVRSSLTAQSHAGDHVDIRALAAEADVDLVLTGTLLRAGDRLRVTAQLSDALDGRVLWSETQQGTMNDLFQLQDELSQRIVSSLATPLSARDHRILTGDVPASARAFELYLRANELAVRPESWTLARELYNAALAEDPAYAPAWARLGRVHRVLAKFSTDPAVARHELQLAEQAFQRTLELNPDLPIAHSLYAQHQVASGQPRAAMLRLLELIRVGGPNAEVYAGLVHALRYCGLLEESLAAHHAARSVDPAVLTSVEYTLLGLGRWEQLLATGHATLGSPVETALAALGRYDEALAGVQANNQRFQGMAASFAELQIAAITAMRDGAPLRVPDRVRHVLDFFPDAEGKFFAARCLAGAGATEDAVALLTGVVPYYFCHAQLRDDPWLNRASSHPQYETLLARAGENRERALTSYFEASGPELIEPAALAA